MLIVTCFFIGCEGEVLNRPPVYKVTGKVTFKGQPVANADVTFSNKDHNRSAFGRTNEDGEYELTTFQANDGAVAGKHSVFITKLQPPADTPAIAPIESEQYIPPGVGVSTDPVKPKSDIPEKYGAEATSGLIAVVNEDNNNVANFDLK